MESPSWGAFFDRIGGRLVDLDGKDDIPGIELAGIKIVSRDGKPALVDDIVH